MQMGGIPGHKHSVTEGISRWIDIAATLLDLAGIAHDPMDGQTMLPYFAQGEFPARDRYAESGAGGSISMVRADGYKLISTGVKPEGQRSGEFYGPDYHRLAVFNLQADPCEYFNIVDTTKR